MTEKDEEIIRIVDTIEEQLLIDLFKEIMQNIDIKDMSVQVAFDIFQHFSEKFKKTFDSPLSTYGEVMVAATDFISALKLINEGGMIMLQKQMVDGIE